MVGFCLQSSYNVAMVVEVPPVAILPNSVVHSRMLKPFRYQTAGTIMAGKLAQDRGWAINIGEWGNRGGGGGGKKGGGKKKKKGWCLDLKKKIFGGGGGG